MPHSSSLPYGSFLEHFPLVKSPMPTFSKYPCVFKRNVLLNESSLKVIDVDFHMAEKPWVCYENFQTGDSLIRENTKAIFRVKKKREPLSFSFREPYSTRVIKVVIDIDSHMWKNCYSQACLEPEVAARALKFGNVFKIGPWQLHEIGIKLFINGQEKKTGSKEPVSGYVPATGEDSEGIENSGITSASREQIEAARRTAFFERARRAAYEAGRRAAYSATSNDGVKWKDWPAS